MQLNPLQQQQFAQELSKELIKMTMSWDNELKEWHSIALNALNYSSVHQLNIPPAKYGELFKTETHGINMNVVMALCNNMEMVSPEVMGRSAIEWANVIELNQRIGKRWNELIEPVRQSVAKRIELINARPPMNIIKAEA